MLLLLLLHLSGLSAQEPQPISELHPGRSLNGETLRLGRETRYYRLSNLRPGWAYEVRVSHPAWVRVAAIQVIATSNKCSVLPQIPADLTLTVGSGAIWQHRRRVAR